jgi:hypothetical protein
VVVVVGDSFAGSFGSNSRHVEQKRGNERGAPMIYQCRACRYEEPRGCLPTVSCGLYLMFLLFLSTWSFAGIAFGIRAVVENHRPSDTDARRGCLVGVPASAGLGAQDRLKAGLQPDSPCERLYEAPSDAPWWVGAMAVFVVAAVLPIILALPFLGAACLKFLFELIEWLTFFRRRCPHCGSRKWSWGDTRGFGL